MFLRNVKVVPNTCEPANATGDPSSRGEEGSRARTTHTASGRGRSVHGDGKARHTLTQVSTPLTVPWPPCWHHRVTGAAPGTSPFLTLPVANRTSPLVSKAHPWSSGDAEGRGGCPLGDASPCMCKWSRGPGHSRAEGQIPGLGQDSSVLPAGKMVFYRINNISFFKYIFVKVIPFLFLWGNSLQLISNKLILLIAYILGCSGAGELGRCVPTSVLCPLCGAGGGQRFPNGQLCAGQKPVLAADWASRCPQAPGRGRVGACAGGRVPSYCTGSSRRGGHPRGQQRLQSPWSLPAGAQPGPGRLVLVRAGEQRPPPAGPPRRPEEPTLR